MNSNTASRKIGRRIFIALLAINGLIAFGIGLTALINLPFALKTGFGIPYNSDLEVLGMIIGCQLILLAVMFTISIIWIRQGKIAGTTIGITAGLYIFTFGILAFLRLDDTTALLFDGLRGLLTVVAGYFARGELKGEN